MLENTEGANIDNPEKLATYGTQNLFNICITSL